MIFKMTSINSNSDIHHDDDQILKTQNWRRLFQELHPDLSWFASVCTV